MTTSRSTTTWGLSGTYFESCKGVGWHIAEGHVDDVQLSGLNVALAVVSSGHLAQVPWSVALYLDDRADGKQADALTRIFTGQLGGHPERLASHIGNVLAITSTTIDFRADGHRRSLRIGEVGTAEIERVEGQQSHHGLDWELSDKNGSSPLRLRGLTAGA